MAEPTAPTVISPGVHTTETAALVGAAQGGDRAAFGALYERFARLVHGVLLASRWAT